MVLIMCSWINHSLLYLEHQEEPEEVKRLLVSPEFPVFEVDESKVLPETSDVYFPARLCVAQLSGTSTGTNARRRGLSLRTFLDYEFPLPSMSVQEQLGQIIDKQCPLSKIQAKTVAELDVLLSPALDKAFERGL